MINTAIDLDKTLEELRQLLHQYSDLAIDFLHQHNLTEHLRQVHELKAKLNHIKYLLEEKQNNDIENNKHFFQHHAFAIQHAINTHALMQQHFAHISSQNAHEELQKVYRELWQLYERLYQEKEMQEHLQETHTELHPFASPFGGHHEE